MREAFLNRETVHHFVPYAVAATCGFLMVAPVILAPGLPAYQHDWSLPFSSQAIATGLIGHLSLWEQNGLGRPNALASANPLLFILSGIGLILGPIAGAKAAIAGAAVLAALTATFCARRTIGGAAAGCVLAGVLYATSPVLFNKIAAGQIAFWYAYALLPLIFERARAAVLGNRSAIFSTTLLCALTTIQPQFAVFSPIVVAAGAFPFRNVRQSLQLCAAAAGGIAVALAPTAWALFSARSDILAQYPWPVQTWERMHSASLGSALLTSHYIIPYYETALHGRLWFAQAAAAAGILGVVLALRRLQGAALLAMLVAGLCFTTGTAGPLAPLWSWMFAHVQPAAFFRELYNANALIALAYALGVAVVYRAAFLGAAAAAALVVFSAVPFALGSLGAVVHNVVDDNVAFAVEVRSTPPGRILYLPSLTPLVRNGREPGGVDVFATGDRMHPSTTEYPAQFPLTAMSVAGTLNDPWWRRLVEELGVVAAIDRPKLRSETDLGTAGTRAARTWTFARWPGRPLAELAPRATPQRTSYRLDDRAAVQLVDTLGLLPGTSGEAAAIVPQASLQTDDPHADWTPLDRWRMAAPDPATSLDAGAVTSSRTPLRIAVPRGDWSLLAQTTSALLVDDGRKPRRVAARAATWIPLHVSKDGVTITNQGGRAAVYRVASGTRAVPLGPFSTTPVSYKRPWPWLVRLRLNAPLKGTGLLIFRDRYSPQWRLAGARTLWRGIADGYANAFLITDAGPELSLTYGPQTNFFLLAALSWLAYAAFVAAVVRLGGAGAAL